MLLPRELLGQVNLECIRMKELITLIQHGIPQEEVFWLLKMAPKDFNILLLLLAMTLTCIVSVM